MSREESRPRADGPSRRRTYVFTQDHWTQLTLTRRAALNPRGQHPEVALALHENRAKRPAVFVVVDDRVTDALQRKA
jgi:hypothetical protein